MDQGFHQLIAAYLHNALLNVKLTTGLEPLPPNDPVYLFPATRLINTRLKRNLKVAA